MSVLELVVIALGQVIGYRLRAALAVTGVAIGIAAVAFLVSIVTGFEREFVRQMGHDTHTLAYVTPAERVVGSDTSPRLDSHLTKSIVRDIAAVEAGFVELLLPQQELSDERGRATDVRLTATDQRLFEWRGLGLTQGRLFRQDAATLEIIAGEGLADWLRQGGLQPLGATVRILGRRAMVVGVLERRQRDPDSSFDMAAYLSATAVADARLPSSPRLVLRLSPGAKVEPVRVALRRYVNISRNEPGDASLDVNSGSERVERLRPLFTGLKVIGFSVGSVTVFVAALGVGNLLLVSVQSRSQEIGLRRAVGATRKSVLWQFATEAAVMCLSGGLLGISASYLVTLAIDALDSQNRFPHPEFDLVTVAFAFASMCLAAGMASVLPARTAARLSPIDALRRE